MIIWCDDQLIIYSSYLDTVSLVLVIEAPLSTSKKPYISSYNISIFLPLNLSYALNTMWQGISLMCFLTIYLLVYLISQNVGYANFTFILHSYSRLTRRCENLNSGIRKAVSSKYLKIRIKNKLNNYSIKPKQQKEMIQITGIPIDLWRF